MQTITHTKLFGVELSFHFPQGVTGDDLAKIKIKVQRTMAHFDYSVNAMFFVDNNYIRAVIGFEIENFNPYKTYDEFRKPLQRLIDSHKEAATYAFSY